jgi:hypothetical protein
LDPDEWRLGRLVVGGLLLLLGSIEWFDPAGREDDLLGLYVMQLGGALILWVGLEVGLLRLKQMRGPRPIPPEWLRAERTPPVKPPRPNTRKRRRRRAGARAGR